VFEHGGRASDIASLYRVVPGGQRGRHPASRVKPLEQAGRLRPLLGG
jgi:hypothetical protein